MFELRSNLSKPCFEMATLVCFWSNVSNRITHLPDNFFMLKCSCKIVNICSLKYLPSNLHALSHGGYLTIYHGFYWLFFQSWSQLNVQNALHLLCSYDRNKISKLCLNHTMWWRRVLLIFFQLLFRFNNCFSTQNVMLYVHLNFFPL